MNDFERGISKTEEMDVKAPLSLRAAANASALGAGVATGVFIGEKIYSMAGFFNAEQRYHTVGDMTTQESMRLGDAYSARANADAQIGDLSLATALALGGLTYLLTKRIEDIRARKQK